MPKARDNAGATVWLAVVIGLVLLTIAFAYAVISRMTDETQGDLRIAPPSAPGIPLPPKVKSEVIAG